MAHRTRLYQPAGSPLIRGRSKRERALGTSVVGGGVLAFALWAGAIIGDFMGGLGLLQPVDSNPRLTGLHPVLFVSLCVASLVGGYLGAEVARQMGWRSRWKSAAIAAFVLDAIVFLVVR